MTKPTVREQMFYDIFTTALEGGINYWSSCSAYHNWEPNTTVDAVHSFYADIIETGDDGDYDGKVYIIDRSVIAKGYKLATSHEWRSRLRWSSGKPPLVITADTDWDFDAGDADMIVQLGLFGSVVYG